jgi:putative aldouronate transport system substrate-binding protein
MNRFMFKKIIGLLLVVSMLVTLAACGNKDSVDKESSDTKKTTSTETDLASDTSASTETAAEQVAIDPLGKYEEGITLTSVRETYSSMTYPEGDDITNNVYTRAIKEELGIEVQYNWVVDVTQKQTKISTMLASGDMPDFFVADSATFRLLVESDAVMDITELYKQYATDLVVEQDTAFKEGFDSAFVDGKQYGIARLGWGKIGLPKLMWLRTDWLEQSGMSVPKTMEELNALALKFMEDHPGSYGVAIDKVMTYNANSIIGLANAFHAYPKTWIKNADGQIVYGSIQPEMKNTLLELQRMYASGIISQEFGAKDSDKVAQDLAAGKVGIMFGEPWMGYWPLGDSIRNDANAMWKAFEIPMTDSEKVSLQGVWPVDGYYVINKDCKNPEAVIKLLNWYMKGTMDGTFAKAPYNEIDWTNPPVYQTLPDSEYKFSISVANALTSGDTSNLSPAEKQRYDEAVVWKDSKDPAGFGRYSQMGPDGAYEIARIYADDDRIMITELRGSDPEGFASVKATLEKLEDDAFTKIIMGNSIDEFDDFVASWNKLGGEAATKEINDIYNK